MKNLFLFILLGLTITNISCGNEDEEHMHDAGEDFKYHAHIMSPNTEDKHVGDMVHLHVNFESHSGEIVHNVAVKVMNKADNTIVAYNFEEHVHSEERYEHHADLMLNIDNNVDGHSDWIMEAKVFGPNGTGEVIETLEFHVHP